MLAAGVLRVAAPFLPPSYIAWLAVAGVLWAGAFVLFLREFVPMLIAPRADGAAG
jgi:uncharacterized protein involved in response to NO